MLKIILAGLALLGLSACTAMASPTVPGVSRETQPPVAATTAPAVSSQLGCNATYAGPGNEFRADDPAKLDVPGKPKLVEFFAYW